MKVLVLGAGGFLGLNVVDALIDRGLSPLCGRRRRSNVLPLRSRRVPMVVADLDEPGSLGEAMSGVEVVIHAAGYYPRLSLDGHEAIETGIRQLSTALDCASDRGVRRFVYLSSTATVARNPLGLSNESHQFSVAPRFGVYHALKWQMEQIALQEKRLEVTVACPGACIGPWDLRVGTSALLVALARGMDPPHPDGIVNIVDARDVGRASATLALMEEPPNRVILAGGNYRLHELLVRLSSRYGAAEPSPPLTAEEAVELSDREEAKARTEGGRAAISREIVDLIVHGCPVSTALAESALGISWRSIETTLDAFDDWARRMRIIPSPTSAEEAHP